MKQNCDKDTYLLHALVEAVEHGFLPVLIVEDVIETVCEAAGEVCVLREAAGAPHRKWVREGDAGNLN